jgi:hypothetical protein
MIHNYYDENGSFSSTSGEIAYPVTATRHRCLLRSLCRERLPLPWCTA